MLAIGSSFLSATMNVDKSYLGAAYLTAYQKKVVAVALLALSLLVLSVYSFCKQINRYYQPLLPDVREPLGPQETGVLILEQNADCDQIVRSYPNLKHLRASHPWFKGVASFNDNCLEDIKGLVHLEWLDLRGCSQFTDQGLVHLKELPSLRILDLSYCNQITDQGLKNLEGLANLEMLTLCGCNQITDQGVKYLERLPNLQTLILTDCNQVTDQGVENLKRKILEVVGKG